MKKLFSLWWLFLPYIIFLGGYASWNILSQPVSDDAKTKLVIIEPGTSFSSVAKMLEEERIIRSRWVFEILARLNNATTSIQAGQYKLSGAQTPQEILKDLVEGKVLQILFTITEGANLYQVADLMEKAGLLHKAEFLKAASDKSLLKRLNINADTAEGYLFPDTYFLTKGITAQDAIEIFVNNFWQTWKKEGFDVRAKAMGKDVHTVVILASIVEKEAMIPRERPIIAGIFWNRLKKGMYLQADPTVYYGILVESNIQKRRLRWRDLRRKTPYNTYLIKGLPKGPISNPGEESLKAVLYPADTEYLYFVSKNNGSHYFSKTLAEHNRAVYIYQKRKRKPHPSKEQSKEPKKDAEGKVSKGEKKAPETDENSTAKSPPPLPTTPQNKADKTTH